MWGVYIISLISVSVAWNRHMGGFINCNFWLHCEGHVNWSLTRLTRYAPWLLKARAWYLPPRPNVRMTGVDITPLGRLQKTETEIPHGLQLNNNRNRKNRWQIITSVLTLYLVHQQTPPGQGSLLFLGCVEFQPTDPPQCRLSPASHPAMTSLEVLVGRGKTHAVNLCKCIRGATPFSCVSWTVLVHILLPAQGPAQGTQIQHLSQMCEITKSVLVYCTHQASLCPSPEEAS